MPGDGPWRRVLMSGEGLRLGPARELLDAVRPGLDRAYSARSYVVPVGEGILRALFGWGFGDPLARFNQAAVHAGFTNYAGVRQFFDVLVQQMATHDPTGPVVRSWLGRLPLDEELTQRTGARTLG